MTILPQRISLDERFKRCFARRKSGRVGMQYKSPMPTLSALEGYLERAQIQAKDCGDEGVNEIVDYLRDYVGLLKDFQMDPEALELALQEFAVPDR